jgi:uncharacterized protein YprB with RNaseH-like and TPR domain
MTKKELRCKHRHTEIEHPQCFMNGKLIDDAQWWKQVRTGYLDIETTRFDAVFGYMLSWSIEDRESGKVLSDGITRADINSGHFDRRIVKSLLKAMEQFDCVVTYYGTGFDIPFIRTRAYANQLGFFNMGQIKHIDLYYVVKSKLKLNRSSLEAATKLFGIAGKNHVEGDIWLRAALGDPKSMKYILDHNKIDVVILHKLHDCLETQSKFTKRSI